MTQNTLTPPASTTSDTTTGNVHFNRIDQLVRTIQQNRRHLPIRQIIKKLYQDLGEDFLRDTVQGHGWRKPFGYSGDFLMIDKIYTRHTSSNPAFRTWDEYFHQQAAPRAVRNRKEYFKQLLKNRMRNQEMVTLLNVASGPARDLAEAYADMRDPQQLQTTCVDMDSQSVAYAKQLNQPYLSHIKFLTNNVFRFCSDQSFDLIWSAGLFDYFDDKVFVNMLCRFGNYLKPDGEIVIGNFNEDYNPSRAYMEIFGDWYLHHRTEQQLIELAHEAGFEDWHISVNREPENINLFLHLKANG